MKTPFCLFITLALFALNFSALSGQAAPAANPTVSSNAIPQSVFTIPTDKKEGRDPFFPDSTRLWGASASAQPTKVSKPTGASCLILKGLSGVPDHRLAMINGRTMARGEDAEINTDCGRLLVHCVDITASSAIIEVGSERRELHLRSDF